MNSKTQAVTKFLNVDIQVHANFALDYLIDELEIDMFVLNKEHQFVTLELIQCPTSIEGAVLAFYEVYKNLSAKALEIWNRCEKRVFDVGIQGGFTPYEKQFNLSSEIISVVSKMKGEVTVTIYALQEQVQ
jgi:hypothetical protein